MGDSTIITQGVDRREKGGAIRSLVGAGDKIGRLLLPLLVAAVAVSIWLPEVSSLGGLSDGPRTMWMAVLAVGVVLWLWSVVLILTRVPKGELITTGPFSLMKHPLYTSVGLLVLPFGGLLLNTWMGVVLGVVLYAAARMYAPEEEEQLAATFGTEWDRYMREVRMPWL